MSKKWPSKKGKEIRSVAKKYITQKATGNTFERNIGVQEASSRNWQKKNANKKNQ